MSIDTRVTKPKYGGVPLEIAMLTSFATALVIFVVFLILLALWAMLKSGSVADDEMLGDRQYTNEYNATRNNNAYEDFP